VHDGERDEQADEPDALGEERHGEYRRPPADHAAPEVGAAPEESGAEREGDSDQRMTGRRAAMSRT
jgi:hypothetical protein